MKKIINGKVYDTDKATNVAEWSNGYGYRDFQWCEETLYRKRTGEYFLHGEGGPMSRYAESCGGNGWTSGDKIMPLTYEEAREWSEKHLTADEYEAEFGEVIEDDTRTTITLSLPAAVVEKARRAAAEQGVTLSAYIISKLA